MGSSGFFQAPKSRCHHPNDIQVRFDRLRLDSRLMLLSRKRLPDSRLRSIRKKAYFFIRLLPM